MRSTKDPIFDGYTMINGISILDFYIRTNFDTSINVHAFADYAIFTNDGIIANLSMLATIIKLVIKSKCFKIIFLLLI
ncbi:MAG: hypothetical protein Q7U53_03725 [Anaerolineaceae bacterium]|nr:hypothetical protein [Anaerolineaceae bacterium]